MSEFEWYIPFDRKAHGRTVGLHGLYKADTDDPSVGVPQEIAYSLEATGIASPTSCTRHATRELLVPISIRHTTRKLQFGL